MAGRNSFHWSFRALSKICASHACEMTAMAIGIDRGSKDRYYPLIDSGRSRAQWTRQVDTTTLAVANWRGTGALSPQFSVVWSSGVRPVA
ncbi:hypothetical protein CHELA20_51622 [Hyphomicrobiales bacterium]|nr:hypothetical protein CHELA41_23390 [Hyphomicrobiales bacterium]CAH1677342.1 hypothetical protein CHELA20_51622 [Hyphomicrobiales bacterium]